jgi:hypothetical protein
MAGKMECLLGSNVIEGDVTMLSSTWAKPRSRAEIVIEHDDLDAAIAALMQSGGGDDLLITRLKKRKLRLKDEIASLQPAVAQAS